MIDSAFTRMSDKNRPQHSTCGGLNAASDPNFQGYLDVRSGTARSTSTCVGIALPRLNNEKDNAQNFLGCRGSEPSVSRPAERQNSASGEQSLDFYSDASTEDRLKHNDCVRLKVANGNNGLGVFADVFSEEPSIALTANGQNTASARN